MVSFICGNKDCPTCRSRREAASEPAFSVGDYVRFNHPHGSVGRIESVVRDGPFARSPLYYARWVFGRDVSGAIMSALSGGTREHQLVPATEAEYKAMRDRLGFGEPVPAKVVEVGHHAGHDEPTVTLTLSAADAQRLGALLYRQIELRPVLVGENEGGGPPCAK